jgi:hypothetical protein
MPIRWSTALVAVAVSAFVACASPINPSTSSFQAQTAGASASAAATMDMGGMQMPMSAGPTTRQVSMMDACDGPSFNLVLGPGECTRNGGVSFQDLIAQLTANQSAGAWHNAPSQTDAKFGDTLLAFNKGGEVHTFTRVASFGGGVVPVLNALAGTPIEAPECGAESTFVPPGGSDSESLDKTGVLYFQCCIHPWMRTTVLVASR